MTTKHLEFKIGVVTFTGLVLVISFLLLLDNLNPFGTFYRIRVGFEDVEHLMAGAEVNMAGIRIGTVEDLFINLEPHTQSRVITILKIRDEFDIPSHSSFHVTQSGVFGNHLVQIQVPSQIPGDKMTFLSRNSEQIHLGEAPVSMDQLLKEARSMMGKIDSVLSSVNSVLGDDRFQTDMKTTFGHLASASSHLNATLKKLDSEIPEAAREIRGLIEDVRGTVSENRTDLRSTVLSARKLIETLQSRSSKASAHFTKLAWRLNQLTRELADEGQLSDDVRTIRRNLVGSTSDLKKISTRFQKALDNDETEESIKETIQNAAHASRTLHQVQTDLQSLRVGGEVELLYSTERNDLEKSLYLNTEFKGKYRVRIGAKDLQRKEGISTLMAGQREGKLQFMGGVLEDHSGLHLQYFADETFSLGLETLDSSKTISRAFSKFRLDSSTDLVIEWHDFTRQTQDDILLGISRQF